MMMMISRYKESAFCKCGTIRVCFQGGLETSEKMAIPLQAFCDHVNETGWSQWTYVQDELFLPTRQHLRREVGSSVRHLCFYGTTVLQSAVFDACYLYQWRRGRGEAGKGATRAITSPTFQPVRKLFSRNFSPTIQNLGLNITPVKNIGI